MTADTSTTRIIGDAWNTGKAVSPNTMTLGFTVSKGRRAVLALAAQLAQEQAKKDQSDAA
jgi:hypothetical protein